jgi:hypothetical protein
MRVTLKLDCGNAAFDDGPSEVARILADLAQRILDHGLTDRRVFDINGNAVGTFTVTGRRRAS